MSETLEQWTNSHVKEFEKFSISELSEILFHRDEARPQMIDSNYFWSPADGVIINAGIVTDDSPLEIKGKKYTLQKILDDKNYNTPSIVISIFMTFYDVHINRIPMAGRLKYRQVDPLITNNLPMLAVEKGLFANDKKYAKTGYDYHFYNERTINTIYSPRWDLTYNVVQIADEDVNLIVPYCPDQNEMFSQNERFGIIRYGSQCTLVIPLDDRYNMSILETPWRHVKAGVDKLVHIERK